MPTVRACNSGAGPPCCACRNSKTLAIVNPNVINASPVRTHAIWVRSLARELAPRPASSPCPAKWAFPGLTGRPSKFFLQNGGHPRRWAPRLTAPRDCTGYRATASSSRWNCHVRGSSCGHIPRYNPFRRLHSSLEGLSRCLVLISPWPALRQPSSLDEAWASFRLKLRSVPSIQGDRVKAPLGATAMKGRTFWVLLLAFLAGGGVLAWQAWQARLTALPPGIASGNGRIESVQVDVTTKEPGRVEKILVREGDMVHAGQVVAKMDTVTLEAELARAEATVAEQEAKAIEVDAAIAKAESQLKLDRGRVRPHTSPLCPQRRSPHRVRPQGDRGQDFRRRAERREGPAQHGPEVRRRGQGRSDPCPVADRRHDSPLHRRGTRPLSTGRGRRGPGQRRQGPHARQPRRCLHGDLPAGPGRREGQDRCRRPHRPRHRPRIRGTGESHLSSPRRPSSRPSRSRPAASATS